MEPSAKNPASFLHDIPRPVGRSRFLWLFLLLAIHASSSEGFAELSVHPPRGFYDRPLTVTLQSSVPGKIHYSLNGASPLSDQGQVYQAPLKINKTSVLRVAQRSTTDDSISRTTHTFLFVDQVKEQEAKPTGYVTEIESWRLRYDQEFDWAMDPEIVDDLERHGQLRDHLLDLPTLSVVLDRKDFNFLYRNHAERGAFFEKPASIELLYPDAPKFARFQGFHVHCGIRMQGGGAVIKARKKSFRLLFKKDYGPGKLRYPLFESAPHHARTATQVFDNVILRAGGNANWSKDEAWKHEPATYLRDPLVRDSQIAVCGFGARSAFVHLYLNGFYFGLYNLAERPDDKFQASYWGGEAEDYYALNHGGDVGGDASAWHDLFDLARQDDAEARAKLERRIDLPSFCDYLINQWYFGSGDWPWNNYYGGLRVAPQPGPLRFFTWDAEFSLWTHTGYLESNDRAWANPLFVHGFSRRRSPLIALWNAVSEDPNFRLLFADRVYRHCFRNGALTEESTQSRFKTLRKTIENAIVAESARWGDSSFGLENDPRTRDGNWHPECDTIQQLLNGNVAHFITALRDESLYPSIDPPALPVPEGPVAKGTLIEISLPLGNEGTIHFTTDESDPRDPATGQPAATSWKDPKGPLTIDRPTIVKCRLRSPSGEWSALAEQRYLIETFAFPVKITELMANPKGEQALEFLELKNLGPITMPLGSYRFEGIDFQFPPLTTLPPQGVLVLIPNDDPHQFAQRYPRVSVFGHYRQHLSNSGETVSLLDPNGRIVTSATYGEPWPRGADGKGRSLQALETNPSSRQINQWRASAHAGGTPGR